MGDPWAGETFMYFTDRRDRFTESCARTLCTFSTYFYRKLLRHCVLDFCNIVAGHSSD
jgi:hypothetical protein